MPAKRQSAFSRALREAQTPSEVVESPVPYVQPEPPAIAPIVDDVPARAPIQSEPEPTRNRGGRPRSATVKKKFTYYLDATSDDTITAIKKALVRHADVLLDDKGTVVDHALAVMRFGLEDPESRATFLALYDRWMDASDSK